tara:strand:+ start:1216 stop:1533 length:318 start_codon:yes stop_codon:yes gene_type:complete
MIKKIRLLTLLFLINISFYASADPMKKGMELFNGKAMCASCHTLKAAGSQGNVGPNLDSLKPTVAQVKDIVTHGLGAMPAFGEDGLLTTEEIDTVSIYVAKSSGK